MQITKWSLKKLRKAIKILTKLINFAKSCHTVQDLLLIPNPTRNHVGEDLHDLPIVGDPSTPPLNF